MNSITLENQRWWIRVWMWKKWDQLRITHPGENAIQLSVIISYKISRLHYNWDVGNQLVSSLESPPPPSLMSSSPALQSTCRLDSHSHWFAYWPHASLQDQLSAPLPQSPTSSQITIITSYTIKNAYKRCNAPRKPIYLSLIFHIWAILQSGCFQAIQFRGNTAH